jgi:hypothetical protein
MPDITPDPAAAYLAEVRGRAEGITAGPWEHPLPFDVTHGYKHHNGRHAATWVASTDAGDDSISEDEAAANAEFIASARTAVPRLLAAVEAVLAQHQPGRVVILGALCRQHEAHRHFSITSAEAEAVTACPSCTATVHVTCTGCGAPASLDFCPARNAIARELLGEEPAGAH